MRSGGFRFSQVQNVSVLGLGNPIGYPHSLGAIIVDADGSFLGIPGEAMWPQPSQCLESFECSKCRPQTGRDNLSIVLLAELLSKLTGVGSNDPRGMMRCGVPSCSD